MSLRRDSVGKRSYIFITLGIIIVVFFIINNRNDNLITSEYLNGQIITQLSIKNTDNIVSTEFRYETFFLEQYTNVSPETEVYPFNNYEEAHTYLIDEEVLQGKKDYILVQVLVSYDNGLTEIIGETEIKHIKEKVYNDYVINPEFEDSIVRYKVGGLAAIIDYDAYDEDIIFYSNPNHEEANIRVGFHKDYSLYALKFFELIPKDKALEMNYEGFQVIDFVDESSTNDSWILAEYTSFELPWVSLYPYDLEGNKVYYESKDGGLDIINNGEISEIAKASQDKYNQMNTRIPDIRFLKDGNF